MLLKEHWHVGRREGGTTFCPDRRVRYESAEEAHAARDRVQQAANLADRRPAAYAIGGCTADCEGQADRFQPLPTACRPLGRR